MASSRVRIARYRIIRGGSRTAGSAAIRSSAPRMPRFGGVVAGQHDRHRLAGVAAALDQRFDRDLVVAQHGRDVGQHARLVDHHQADVVAARMRGHRRDRMVGQRAGRHAEGRQRQPARDVDDVADHGRGGRAGAGAAALVHHRAHLIALDHHAVEHALDLARSGREPGPCRDASAARGPAGVMRATPSSLIR